VKDTQPIRVRLGVFELDLRTGELRSGDVTTILREQPLQILRLLVEAEGELVSREEIRQKLWPNDTIVEFDHSINAAIKNLRRALGDSADEPKYIETLARRGYRLMVAVQRFSTGDSSGELPQVTHVAAVGPRSESGLAGKNASHYRVLEVIGGGGMGLIYRAEDLKLGRAVALKFLPPEFGSDPRALARFEREARAASSLEHPNICPIYEFGDHKGQPFLVMPLLRGQTLREYLTSVTSQAGPSSDRALPVPELLNCAIQIAEGLEAAHEKGIIHRDIKPANIFLTSKGIVQILDFGVAKLLESRDKEQAAAADDPIQIATPTAAEARAAALYMTRTGVAVGTLSCMSPEQLRGEKLDTRTDLFSFGLIVYEMATGQKAFAANDAAALKDAILNQTPTPPLKLNPRLPHTLGAIIDKCLQKDRNLRYQHASEILAELKSLKRDSEGKLSKRAAVALVAFALIFVAAFAFGLRWFLARPRPQPFSKFAISQVTDTGLASAAAISPDGKFILNVQNDNGQQSLWLRNVPSGSDTQIIPPAPVMYRSVNFSPDGNYIYFRRGMGRTPNLLDEFRAPLLGGEPQMVVHDIDTNVSFSPDGSRMVFFRDNNPSAGRMRLISTLADGKDEKVLLEAKLYSAYRVQPAWSPDGKVIAFTEDFAEGALGRVQLLDLASGHVRTLYSTKDEEFLSLAWVGSGTIAVIYSSKSSGLRQGQIGLISYPGGSFRPLTNDTTSYVGAHLLAPVSASATGREIVAVQNKVTDRIEVMTLGAGVGSDLKEIMSVHDWLGGLSWTPEGKILYARRNRLMLVNGNGSEETVFASDPSMSVSDSDVCRDGRHVVFLWRFHDGTFFENIAKVDMDGSNAGQLTSGETYFFPRCSPDSQQVAFQDQNNKQLRIPLGGGTPEVFMREWNISNLSWSPDGKQIALRTTLRTQKGAYENKIVLYSFDSHTKKYLPCNPNFSANGTLGFSPDGKSIAYAIREKRGDNIWLQPLDGSPGRTVTNFPDDSIAAFRFSPDGKHLALIHRHTESDVVLIRDANGQK
jgi:serine/threonine protein kinase